jgi:hypothetical protein
MHGRTVASGTVSSVRPDSSAITKASGTCGLPSLIAALKSSRAARRVHENRTVPWRRPPGEAVTPSMLAPDCLSGGRRVRQIRRWLGLAVISHHKLGCGQNQLATEGRNRQYRQLTRPRRFQMKKSANPTEHRCPACNGTGSYRNAAGATGPQNLSAPCKKCGGKGLITGAGNRGVECAVTPRERKLK